MTIEYAEIVGAKFVQGTTIGMMGTLYATPQTSEHRLTWDDDPEMTGAVTATIGPDDQGQFTINIPLGSEQQTAGPLYWLFEFKPALRYPGVPPTIRDGISEVTESGPYDGLDLEAQPAPGLSSEDAANIVAAANAVLGVVATTDGLMDAVAADDNSDFRGTTDALYGLKPTNGARSVGKGELLLHVEDHGAVGNGSTDDTTAIQSALTAARAAKARLRFGFNKTYITSGPLNPFGVRVEGFGATVKLKAGITANFNAFQSSGACSISDLLIDLNKANNTDPAATTQGLGIYVQNAAGWSGVASIRDVQIINGHQAGLRIAGSSGTNDSINAPLARASVVNLAVDSCDYGVWIQTARGVTLINPDLSNIVEDGIYDYFTRGTRIIGGYVNGAGRHGVVTQYSVGFLANGVTADDATQLGFAVGGGSATIAPARDFRIIGCHAYSCGDSGFSVDTTKTGGATTLVEAHGTIQGCHSRGNGDHGYFLHNTKYLAFTGNVASGNTLGGLGMDAYGIAVDGNVFVGNSYGIGFFGNVSGYGSHRVGKNVNDGNTNAFYFDSHGADNTTLELEGTGSPASVVAAPVGSTYRRHDGSTSTTLYVKETGGITTSGWVAK